MNLENLGLLGLFIGTFLAATILPFSSDALYIAVLAAVGNARSCLLVGTLGNWLGSVLTYWIGWIGKWEWIERWFKVKPETMEKQRARLDKYGVWLALFAWVPIIGDVFAITLGFFRVRPFWTIVLLLLGKGIRFWIWTAAVTGLLGCSGTGIWSDESNWYRSTREVNEDYPDVFYLVSTNIMHEEGSLIASYSPEEKALLTKEMQFIETRMFPDSLNFFAPYYHQHTMEAINLEEEAYDILSDDIADEVYEAFRYYMRHLSGGRKVVLVGFSQGAMLVKELLMRMTPREYSRIAAAYMLGWGLNEEDVAYPQIRPALGRDDTGVCISFNSVADTSAVWRAVMDDAAYAINPVNWKTDSTPASFEFNGQTLCASLDTASKSLVVRGFEQPKLPFSPVWPSGCLHFYEIQFYNGFIWHNALQRCRELQVHSRLMPRYLSL